MPTSDWFCQDCIADREYLYDHASWGDAGRTLVRLASQHGAWTAKGEAAKLLEKRIREWQDNDVIKLASQRALELGFGDLALPPPDKHQRQDDAAAHKLPHLLEAPIVKMKPGRPNKVKPPATDAPAPRVVQKEEEHRAPAPAPFGATGPRARRARLDLPPPCRSRRGQPRGCQQGPRGGDHRDRARDTLLDVLRKTTAQE